MTAEISPGTFYGGNASYDFAPGTFYSAPSGAILSGAGAGAGSADARSREVMFTPVDWSKVIWPEDPSRGMGEIRKGINRGIQQGQAMLYGAISAIGDKFELDDLRDWGIEGYQRNMEEAQKYPAATPGFTDISGVGSAIDWAAGTFGELIPTMAASIISGGIGSFVGKTVGARVLRGYAANQIAKYTAEHVAKGMTAGDALALAGKQVASQMARTGSMAGLIGYTSLSEGGSNYGRDVEAHGVGNTSPGMDMLFGLVSGVAEGIMGAESSFLRALTGRVASEAGEVAFRKILVRELPKAMLSESGTEAFQEIASAVNANIQDAKGLITADDISDIINAAAAGALGGGMMHPMTSYFESKNRKAQQQLKDVAAGNTDVTDSTNKLNDIADMSSIAQQLEEERNPWEVARAREEDYLRQWEDFSRGEVENFNNMFATKEQTVLDKFNKFIESGTIQQGESIDSIQSRLQEMPAQDSKSIGKIIAEYSALQKDKTEKRKALESRINKGFRAQDGKLITAAYKQSIQDRLARQRMDASVDGALTTALSDAVTYAQKVGATLDSRIATISQAIDALIEKQNKEQAALKLTPAQYRRYQHELNKLQSQRTKAIRSKRNISKTIGNIMRKAKSVDQADLGSIGASIQELRNLGDTALELGRTKDIFRSEQMVRVEELQDKYNQLLDSLKKAQSKVDSVSNDLNSDRTRAVKNLLNNTRNTIASVDIYRDMPLTGTRRPPVREDAMILESQEDKENSELIDASMQAATAQDNAIRDQQQAEIEDAIQKQTIANETGQKNIPDTSSVSSQVESNPQELEASASAAEIQQKTEQKTHQSLATSVRQYTPYEQLKLKQIATWLDKTLQSLPVLKDNVILCVRGDDPVLPVEVQNSIKNVKASPRGVYWNGKVYLFASNILSKNDAVRTLVHEGVAHYGLRSIMTNEQLGKFLNLVFNSFKKTDEWRQFAENRPQYFKSFDRVTQAEEFVAYIAEQMKVSQLLRPSTQSIFNRVVSFLKKVLASLGLRENVTVKDIRDVLSLSAQNLARMQDGNIDKIKQIEVLTSSRDHTISPNTLFQLAFHGTPHNFDQFTLDHIGSGEGAQAHGWGLYFAQDKDVSINYKNRLGNKTYVVKLNNKSLKFDQNEKVWIADDGTIFDQDTSPIGAAANILLHNGDVQSAIEYLKDIIDTAYRDISILKQSFLRDRIINRVHINEKALQLLQNGDATLHTTSRGTLFEVDIPENAVLLDEQETFAEQPSYVQNALRKLSEKLNFNFTETTTGRHIYYNIMSALQKKGLPRSVLAKEASKSLNGVGISGITYNGATDGRCFVIFDDKAINILNKLEDTLDENPLYSFSDIPVNDEPVYGMKFDSAEASQEYYKKLEGSRSGNTNTPYILNLPKNSNTLNLNDTLAQQPDRVQSRLNKLLTSLGVQPRITQDETGAFSVSYLNVPVLDAVSEEDVNQYVKNNEFLNDVTGDTVYKFLVETTGSKRDASKMLRDFGIRGAQYAEGNSNNYYLFEGNDMSTEPYQYNSDILTEPKFLVTEETPTDEITVDSVTGEVTTKDTADGQTYMNTILSDVSSQSNALRVLKDVLDTGKHRDADGNLVEHTLWERIKEQAVDQYRRLYVVQNYLKRKFPGIINGVTNVYQQLQGLTNRIRGQQVDYRNAFFRPAIEALQKIDAPIPVYDEKGKIIATCKKGDAKYDELLLAMLDDVLMARHAPERNKSVSERMRGHRWTIKDDDGNVIRTKYTNRKSHSPSSEILNASGMSDEQAAVIMERYGNFPGLDEVILNVDKINKFILNSMLEHKLITQEAYDRMSQYEFYVPLQGWQENLEKMYPAWFSDRSAKSLSTGGKKVARYAKGRGGLPLSPFLRSVQQMDDIIAVIEQNTLMKKFGELVSAVNKTGDRSIFEFDNKNPEAVRLQVLPDGSIGFVTKTSEFQGSGEGAVTYIDDGGEIKRIVIHDKWLAAAMTGTNRAPTGAYVNTLRKYTGLLTQLMTSRNPAFAVVNPIRDLPSALLNIGSSIEENVKRGLLEETQNIQRGVIQDVFSGKVGRLLWDISVQDETGKKLDESKYDAELLQDLYDWRTYGGHTRMLDSMTIKDLGKDVRKALRNTSNIRSIGSKIISYMDILSDTTENMTRFSVYHQFMKAFKKNLDIRAKEEGWDASRYQYELDIAKQKSVNISLECTVNFTKKGAAANLYNPLWAFSSASLQSFSRIVRNLWRSTSTPQENFKRVSKFIAGGIAFPIVWNSIVRAWMGDDDDGINKYDKIPEYIKYNHLIIPMPFGDGGYVKIPLPYGYNVFTAAGNIIDAVVHGTTTPGSGAFNLMKIALAGVSPVDPSDQGIIAFVPTLFKPVVEVAANVNFTGAPIMPSGPGVQNLPDYLKSWASTPQIYKDVAGLLNFISGGWVSKDGIGLLDISPETIEHITMSYTGGIGRLVQQALTLISSPAFGTEIGAKDVPIINRLYGTTTYQNNNALYNRYNDQILQARALMKEAENNPEEARSVRDNFRSALSLEKAAQATTNQLNKLRQAERDLRRRYPSGTKSREFNARTQLIQKQRESIMKRFNSQANRAGLTMD